jgi:DNA-binding response OmpR family regulator
MFSADALPCRREQALEAGFIDLWVKPMGRDELLLRLRQLMSRPRPRPGRLGRPAGTMTAPGGARPPRSPATPPA